jgi:LuxR family transcriptional regulator, maltose regulon positive regulatory protein
MATKAVANRRRIIRRPRLTKLLDENSARIKLLIAPAGYGKTTLAQQWLSEPERQDVWYRGGPAAADVAALAAGLAVAASDVLPGAGARMRERLRATGHPEEDVDILAELFAEDVQQWPNHAWLAVDDYQFAMESAASERFVDLLTQQTPIQLVVTSRRRPTWATARRILYGEIQEIDRRLLTMEKSEATQVLGVAGVRAKDLIERARGWPAVLGIAVLTPNYASPPDDLPDALYSYFAEELYRGATPSLRTALHRLALVPAMSLDFAQDLFGRQTSEMVEDCSRIGAISSGRDELTLHPLLRTFLNKKLAHEDPNELRTIAKNMAELLMSLRKWDEAFQVVSTYASPDLVVPLVEAAHADLLAEGRTQTLVRWLDLAGRNHLAGAALDFAEAEVVFRQGYYAKAEALAAEAATASSGPKTSRMLIRAGQSAVMDSRDDKGLGHFREARKKADTELDKLEADVGICFAALELGLPDEAGAALEELSFIEARGADIAVRKAVVKLVYASRAGGVQSALPIGATTLPLLEDVKDPLVVTSFLNCYGHVLGLAALYPAALDIVEQEVSTADRYRLRFVLPHALLTKAVAHCGLRAFSKASIEIAHAEELAVRGDIYVSMYAAALRARLALSRQHFREAIVHSSQTWERDASAPMMAEYLAYGALSYACLGNARAAEEMAHRARETHATSVETITLAACADAVVACATEDGDAVRVASEAYALIQNTGAWDTLVTVARAYPLFVKALLRGGNPAEPLKNLLWRSNDSRLARTLDLDDGAAFPAGPMGELTHRELEVAQLVAEGLTNKEIADRLFISVSTAKVHVRHILRKMNARTRTEVAARVMSG